MSVAWRTAVCAGDRTEVGSSRARHRVHRGTAAATALRTVALSARKPAPLSARGAYLARSSAIAMRLKAACAGGVSSRVLAVRAATFRGDWLGR